MKWITREKVKVDRVACPWLIRKLNPPDNAVPEHEQEMVIQKKMKKGKDKPSRRKIPANTG